MVEVVHVTTTDHDHGPSHVHGVAHGLVRSRDQERAPLARDRDRCRDRVDHVPGLRKAPDRQLLNGIIITLEGIIFIIIINMKINSGKAFLVWYF